MICLQLNNMKNIFEVWHYSMNNIKIWSIIRDIDIRLTENSEDEGLHIPNHPGRVRRRLPPAPADDDDTCSKCLNFFCMLQFFSFLFLKQHEYLYSN